jgi:hypothetical protein
MTLEGFSTLLDARYTEIKQLELSGITNIIPMVYTERQTDRLDQFHTEVGGFSYWEEFTGEIRTQRMYEQYQSQSRPRAWAMMAIIDRRMVRFDLSNILDGKQFRPMLRAGMLTKQRHATELFEFLTVNDTRWYARSEGVPLVSNNHLTRTPGVSVTAGFDNYTPATLSPVALKDAMIAGFNIRNSEGQIMELNYDAIVLPRSQVEVYNEIANTLVGYDTPGQNQNQQSRERSGIRDVIMLPQWSSTTGWGLVNRQLMKDNCTWYTAEEEDYGSITEFSTLQIKTRGYMDHGFMVDGWRWIYGGGM